MNLDKLHSISPYSLSKDDKGMLLLKYFTELTDHHKNGCKLYSKMLDGIGCDVGYFDSCEDIPFIPVRMFKEFELISVPRDTIIKTLTSSGTSGQMVSKIFLDKQNIREQTRTLTDIITSYIGKQRLPLLLLDTELLRTDRNMFSARGAGITGFTTFGRDVTYALNNEMQLDLPKVIAFLERHCDEQVLMFGYTFMIWEYIVRALENLHLVLPTRNVTLFHIGGWKRLYASAVDNAEFNNRLNTVLGGNTRIYNYYGMAEQLGSVFVECEYGHMHCSNFSDVLFRRPSDFSIAHIEERGLIELLSVLPTSYPGHALLTEDEGILLGVDDCQCGRKGKYFKILGRVQGAEIRGCSDTYERS